MEVNERVRLDWNNMVKGITAQVGFLTEEPEIMYRQWQGIIAGIPAPRRLYMVGCGDSYFCGVAAERIFKESGIDAMAMESLEFSRYELDFAQPEDWLVATSNSGKVSRTIECVIRARKQGLKTWGISYNPQGRLAIEAERTLFYTYGDVGFGPGTISYTASMVAQITLAAALADRVNPSRGQGAYILEKLTAMSHQMRTAIDHVFDAAISLGRKTAQLDQVVVIGGGPNYATALFGMAKQIESARHNTVAQELEEWAHEQYFCTEKGTLTMVIAPPGRSVDRAREQLQAVRDMGGTSVVLCSADDNESIALAEMALMLPATEPKDEWITPLLYQIPLQIFSYAFAQESGTVMLGFDDPERMRVNFRQIFGSTVQE